MYEKCCPVLLQRPKKWKIKLIVTVIFHKKETNIFWYVVFCKQVIEETEEKHISSGGEIICRKLEI